MVRAEWLLCDADDTLWENNIYFEEAIREFIGYVDHPTLGPAAVRERLDGIEARNTQLHGYGTENFVRNMIECFEALRGRPAREGERRNLRGLADRIVNSPVRPIEGVEETLADLGIRYRLGLVTKGVYDEQHAKLERSGLADRFEYVANVAEKDAGCYRSVLRSTGADAGSTWMIGNSPKSDINPALEAGLGAVLVRNANTWSLELQPLPDRHERFRFVERFSDLLSIF